MHKACLCCCFFGSKTPRNGQYRPEAGYDGHERPIYIKNQNVGGNNANDA